MGGALRQFPVPAKGDTNQSSIRTVLSTGDALPKSILFSQSVVYATDCLICDHAAGGDAGRYIPIQNRDVCPGMSRGRRRGEKEEM